MRSAARRIGAMTLRHLYIMRGSWPRVLEMAYWPAVNMLVWGFTSQFFAGHSDWVSRAAGVLIGIEGARSFNNVRQARFNAGTAVANGLPYAAALAAVTVNQAKIWGFSDKAGSLEPGKDADLVLWSGDPFETATYAVAVFINGRQQPQDARILKLRDRYAKPADGYPSAYH